MSPLLIYTTSRQERVFKINYLAGSRRGIKSETHYYMIQVAGIQPTCGIKEGKFPGGRL